MASAPLTSVLTGMNTIGLFASRAFVSAFAVAAVLKWGPDIGFINDTGLLKQVTDVPSWFTHDLTVTILGFLAALEIAATKSADARALMIEIDGYLKSSTAFITTLVASGILTSNDAAVIKQITTWHEPVRAGLGDSAMNVIAALLSGAGVWFACSARRAVLGSVIEADPGDDTMVMGLFSWFEDLWALVGTLLLILFPIFMLAITALVLGCLGLLQYRAKRREAMSQVDCTHCGSKMYKSAVRCGKCKMPNKSVYRIGWLGQTTDQPAQDLAHQPVALALKLRCPVCASYLKPRTIRQDCEACGHEVFAEQAEVDDYLRVLDRRLPRVLIVTALLSLIPVVGLIPAIIVYRIRLVSPLRQYTSMLSSVPARWGLRLLFLVLIWMQVLPGIGALAVPLMALLSYGTYRRLFLGQLERERQRGQQSAVQPALA